jgi:hypothetical protein
MSSKGPDKEGVLDTAEVLESTKMSPGSFPPQQTYNIIESLE